MPEKCWRRVVLPDGLEAWECKTVYVGGSETQLVYEYASEEYGEFDIDLSRYRLDYWGKVVEVRDD